MSSRLAYLACVAALSACSPGVGPERANPDSMDGGGDRDTSIRSEDAGPFPNDAGANVMPLEAGVHVLSLSSGGLERTFRLYVPEGLGSTDRLPLVMIFHGGGGDADRVVAFGFDGVADQSGFFTVYPNGVDGWADGRGTTGAELAGVDDVEFVRDLIAYLSGALPVDPNRVFATGASNGGMMSYRLGCELSDKIAAIAPVIAAVPTNLADSCNPEQPVSVLSIHGTDDPFINFEGGDAAHEEFPRLGEGGLVESAESSRDIWKANNNCADAAPVQLDPVVADDPTRVELTAMDDCDAGASVHYYVIDGMGHTWPGVEVPNQQISGPGSQQLDATTTIWDFFEAHPREALP